MSARNACGKTSSTLLATCSAGPKSADQGDALSSRFAFVLWSGKLGGTKTSRRRWRRPCGARTMKRPSSSSAMPDRLGERLRPGGRASRQPRRPPRVRSAGTPSSSPSWSAKPGPTERCSSLRATWDRRSGGRYIAVDGGGGARRAAAMAQPVAGRRLVRRVDRALGTWAHSVEVAACEASCSDETGQAPPPRARPRAHPLRHRPAPLRASARRNSARPRGEPTPVRRWLRRAADRGEGRGTSGYAPSR